MENHSLQSAPARRDFYSNYQEIIRKYKTELSIRTDIKKNCWLLQKLSHETERNLMDDCFKQAMERSMVIKEMQGEDGFEGRYQRQIILKKIKLSVSKNMMKLEQIFKNFLRLKKTQIGYIRMT